jgi:hypothetical protein
MKRLCVLILLVGLLVVGVSVSQAETYEDWAFYVSPTTVFTSVCNANGSFSFYWRVNYDLPTSGIFQVFTAHRNGTLVYTNPVAQPFSGVGAVNGIWSGGASATPTNISLTWIYSYQGVNFYYSKITFTCSAGAFSNVTYSNNSMISANAPDDRINYQHGDLFAAAYVRQDSAGDPTLDIYCIDSSNRGAIGLIVTHDELNGAVPTAGNTLIAQTDQCTVGVAVYRLASGEYQLNIGPDPEGKIYVTIWTGMPISDLHYETLELGDS